ncbi:MAG TPA: glycoside hydrolase family 3 N-terminal domain-containing protein, partial [Usitatibacter sp.]|nr:glycoside hydrolase family 3 N-terminal domain-containing protein [Usitatibacter sp.]
MTPVPRALQLRGMPSPIALAATWDPALVARVYAAAAAEASAGGATLVLGPSLAVGRDPRRGRIEETFGEDPFLVGQLGISALEGLQGTLVKGRLATGKVLAAPTGFAGPGLPRDAAGTAPMADRELRSVYIAPFAEAIGRAHVAAIVPSRNMLDGVPSHANPWLLRHVLREELGFTGTVIADPEGVGDLSKAYHVARDEKDAARLARDAGVDAFDSGAALAQTVANARPKATKADAAAF